MFPREKLLQAPWISGPPQQLPVLRLPPYLTIEGFRICSAPSPTFPRSPLLAPFYRSSSMAFHWPRDHRNRSNFYPMPTDSCSVGARAQLGRDRLHPRVKGNIENHQIQAGEGDLNVLIQYLWGPLAQNILYCLLHTPETRVHPTGRLFVPYVGMERSDSRTQSRSIVRWASDKVRRVCADQH